jgi:parallel beta-helix repeat protein
MRKGLAWSWLVLIVVIISTVATVAFVFKTPFKFEIESEISRKELEEFLKKESQEPENYILEQIATTNIQGSGEEVESYLQALKLSEIKATYKTMKRGELKKSYTEIEKPNKEVTVAFDYPYYYKDDYECEKKEEKWSCRKAWFTVAKPEMLEMLGMGYLENLEEVLEKKDLVEIHGTKKRCFGHDCICVNIDARKLLEEAFKKSVGEAAKVDKFSAYSCMEEKSKINLEMKIDYEISFKAGEKRSSIKIVGNVNTLRFEETEPPLEEFRLPTKGEKKILYVCENCEYKDLKKALDDVDIGDTIIITDGREYEGKKYLENETDISSIGITIDCGGSALKVGYIHGDSLIFKNCKFMPIRFFYIKANNVEITNSTINATLISLEGNGRKIVNSQINGSVVAFGKTRGIEIKNSQISPEGINLMKCEDVKIEGNIISTIKDGIELDKCEDVKIEGNTIQGGGGEKNGIYVSNSTRVSIIGNEIMNFWWGIWISYSKEIELKENSFINVVREIGEVRIEEIKPLQEKSEITKGECTNDAQCSQACTTLCPANVYGCCYGCKLGRCIDGKCECVEAVKYCSRNPNYQVGAECKR